MANSALLTRDEFEELVALLEKIAGDAKAPAADRERAEHTLERMKRSKNARHKDCAERALNRARERISLATRMGMKVAPTRPYSETGCVQTFATLTPAEIRASMKAKG
jgi:hypothetical protein